MAHFVGEASSEGRAGADFVFDLPPGKPYQRGIVVPSGAIVPFTPVSGGVCFVGPLGAFHTCEGSQP